MIFAQYITMSSANTAPDTASTLLVLHPALTEILLQANTVIKSEPSQRNEAFTDVEVNMRQNENGAVPNGDRSGSASLPTEKPQTDGGPQLQNGAAKPAAAEGKWTDEQELALVKALKQYGKELEDRWDMIAKAVPDQNKASCFRRFKQLRQSVRASKS